MLNVDQKKVGKRHSQQDLNRFNQNQTQWVQYQRKRRNVKAGVFCDAKGIMLSGCLREGKTIQI